MDIQAMSKHANYSKLYYVNPYSVVNIRTHNNKLLSSHETEHRLSYIGTSIPLTNINSVIKHFFNRDKQSGLNITNQNKLTHAI